MTRETQTSAATFLFAGGGTGGHLMPGLSVAEELRKRSRSDRIVFAGNATGMDRALVERREFEFVPLPSMKFVGNPATWLTRFPTSLLMAMRAVQQIRPDVVISLGGYAAMGPSVAGLIGGIPIVVMEQNALPGKVSKVLSWWAQEVCVAWPGTQGAFAYPERVHVTGNPVRDDLCRRRSRAPAARFGLSPRKRTLLVMGGSQGAQFLNRTMIEALPLLKPHESWLQVLHSAGKAECEEVKAAYARHGIRASVHAFIEDMGAAYAACDLALCRAGGTTLAELTTLGVPAIVVPLPTAKNDHQRKNASLVASEGGALLVDQADLTAERLIAMLVKLLSNESCLARMRAASMRIGRPAATRNVAARLLSVARRPVPPDLLEAIGATSAPGA